MFTCTVCIAPSHGILHTYIRLPTCVTKDKVVCANVAKTVYWHSKIFCQRAGSVCDFQFRTSQHGNTSLLSLLAPLRHST